MLAAKKTPRREGKSQNKFACIRNKDAKEKRRKSLHSKMKLKNQQTWEIKAHLKNQKI